MVTKNISMSKQGLFVTFEGPDGSGKTSVVNLFKKYCRTHNLGKTFVFTREPGGEKNLIAEGIRNIILDSKNKNLDYRAECLLFAASRAQHVSDFIQPNLRKGNVIICDRFIHSSIVYQGYVRGLGKKIVEEINNCALNNVKPDLTFVFMLPAKDCIKRIFSNKGREVNRLDSEGIKFFNKVYAGYQRLIKEDRSLIVIDASKDSDIIFADILKRILKIIKK